MLAGTLTTPKGDGPFPTAILISGSGPQDRDNTIYGHKSFLVIADYFAKQGIAVLRFDDRGVAKSKGNLADATTRDFADDVQSVIDWLKTQPKIDANKIILIGHSEGGLIAPMIAAERDDVRAIIMLAGPSVSGDKIVLNQSRKIAETAGASPLVLDSQDKLLNLLLEKIKTGQPFEDGFIDRVIADVRETLPEEEKKEFEIPESSKSTMAQMDIPWFRYFLAYDPAPSLKKVKCPILYLIGDLDLQVDPDLNIPVAEKIFKESGNSKTKIVRFPKLNHLFQKSTTGLPDEYMKIEQSFDPEVLQQMSKWIIENTR